MNKLLEKHEIEESFYIYRQGNSRRWYARFKIGTQWISRATKESEKKKAVVAAIRVKVGCDALHEAGHTIRTKAFRDVAKIAIERMQSIPKAAKGAASMLDYEHALNKYHIPFFDRVHVTSIDYEMLEKFDNWRIEKLGRTPAQSTLKTHNAALQRVFDVAVKEKWINESQIPRLTVAGGVQGERRDYFTPMEIAKIDEAFPAWIAESRKEVTRQIRDLLFFYFQVALHTGIRPGTEMDNLRWSDIRQSVDADGVERFALKVRKGKTSKSKGTRTVQCHGIVYEMILDYSARFEENKDDDLFFRLPNGEVTKELGKNFTALLKRLGLNKTDDGKRSLYSLRHTYITLQILAKVPPNIIAKNCGTSPEMIQQHYDHVTAQMFAKELTDNPDSELNKMLSKYADVNPELTGFGWLEQK